MATVNVSTWSEFMAAVQVSGDTVNCAQNAVWDFNELYPGGWGYGAQGRFYIETRCAKIIGNGAKILNAHTYDNIFYFRSGCEISDFGIENFVAEKGLIWYSDSAQFQFSRCRFSGLLGEYPGSGDYAALYGKGGGSTKFYSCAFTLESATQRAFRIGWLANNDNDLKKYCRIRLYLPNSTGYAGEITEFSRVDVDCPAQTVLYTPGASGNIYGGDLPLVASVSGSTGQFINLFDSDTMPNLTGTAGVVGVTEAQLHDADYLSSIGFPIGVDA